MKFEEYFNKICEACIVNVGVTWSSYLEPTYKIILKNLELEPSIVEDANLTMDDVSEMLKLEIERRHVVTGKGRALSNWIYEIINGTIEPVVQTGETELFNKIIDLLRKDKEENGVAEVSQEENKPE